MSLHKYTNHESEEGIESALVLVSKRAKKEVRKKRQSKEEKREGKGKGR
jgi:hypothetical protein